MRVYATLLFAVGTVVVVDDARHEAMRIIIFYRKSRQDKRKSELQGGIKGTGGSEEATETKRFHAGCERNDYQWQSNKTIPLHT